MTQRDMGHTGGEVHAGVRWGNMKERDHLGDPVVDGRIILKCLIKKQVMRADSIHLAQWRAVVNTVMNLRVP